MIGKLLRWGNSYGIRLSKREVQERHLREGGEYDVKILDLPRGRIDISRLSSFDLGGNLSVRHDEVDWA